MRAEFLHKFVLEPGLSAWETLESRKGPGAHASNALLLQNDSSWSLLCREEGTWFLAGIRDSFSGCLRPRAFSPLQTHGPWISHVTRGAYLEDQLAWDWGPEGEETETRTCPPHTEHGGEHRTLEA